MCHHILPKKQKNVFHYYGLNDKRYSHDLCKPASHWPRNGSFVPCSSQQLLAYRSCYDYYCQLRFIGPSNGSETNRTCAIDNVDVPRWRVQYSVNFSLQSFCPYSTVWYKEASPKRSSNKFHFRRSISLSQENFSCLFDTFSRYYLRKATSGLISSVRILLTLDSFCIYFRDSTERNYQRQQLPWIVTDIYLSLGALTKTREMGQLPYWSW